MIDYIKIINPLRQFDYLGESKLDNGTILIGKAPHIAPMAWLHSIHHPLTDVQIGELEEKIKIAIPSEYKDFLKTTNGLKVFNTTFCLDGLRNNYRRTVSDVWQPFDIIIPNTLERPKNAEKNLFFIGSYDWDGSRLYMTPADNKVHFCDRDDATSLYEWDNFPNMLESEIQRLIRLFDKQGKQINEDESTLPI